MAESSLKILQVCPKYPYPLVDGGAIAMFNMTRAFYNGGHDVTVLGMNTAKHNIDLKDFPDSIRRMANFHAVEVNTQTQLFDALASFMFARRESYHVRRFTSDLFEQELIHILTGEEDFDVIQLETLYMAIYLPLIRKYAPDALISLRIHNIEHEIWKRIADNTRNPLWNFVYSETAKRIEEYERKVFAEGKYDVLVPITRRDGGKAKGLGNERPDRFCLSGMDMATIDSQRIKQDYNTVFFLGALDWRPNLEGLQWFLKFVWPIIHRTYPDVKFHIAGRRMPNSISGLKGKNIVIDGEVPDAVAYMKSKGVMIAPLFSGSGMRVKLMEGMAYGKAIVGTHISAEGIPGVRHGDHMLLTDDSVEFANHVSVLLEDHNLLRTLGNHAKSLVKDRFDNDKLVGDLIGFYHEQLKRKRR